jgi:queuine/archaeosine tRNA-ribosyltransferase
MTAARLLTLHNVAFYVELVTGARRAIERGAYDEWAKARLSELESRDSDEAFGG